MNTPETHGLVSSLRWTAIATAVGAGAWFLLVRPVEIKSAQRLAALTGAQREVSQFESGSMTATELEPAIKEMRGRLRAMYDWTNISGDAGKLYDALRRLAEASGVRIERIEPSTSRALGPRAGAESPREPKGEAIGYAVELTGPYDAIATFASECERKLGATRVCSIRINAGAPTPEGRAPIVSGTLETVHVRLTPPTGAKLAGASEVR